jgi:hypothetical protein
MMWARRGGTAALCALLATVALAQKVGDPAPELNITAARGIGKDTKLADLKGKWVVIEFWGHW